MNILVDTSGIYAMLDADDQNHRAAAPTWIRLLETETQLTTTNYTLIETSALVQRRLGTTALRVFHEDICPIFDIDWVTQEQHQAAVNAMLVASRRKLSLVDCISFECARRHGIRYVFGFDAHFRELGLRLISPRVIK
jgi:uncharacterized protein